MSRCEQCVRLNQLNFGLFLQELHNEGGYHPGVMPSLLLNLQREDNVNKAVMALRFLPRHQERSGAVLDHLSTAQIEDENSGNEK
ncbi:hypothetical protein DV515_00008086 [Chloebia gouldiae]|uniref:Uncharacterized protein n=1 Tax=Chloebia gouldiae TaxID=44316 RepID=A0A3L8SFH0_CHLGU|nr:hypothetical protein DV515_00008086 [Chloebia gouldiae]